MKNIRFLCLILIILFLHGCKSVQHDEQKSDKKVYPRDSWYSDVPSSLTPWDWDKIEQLYVFEVDRNEDVAEGILHDKTSIPISAAQFQSFTGKQLTSLDVNNRRPFLVRSLYINKMPRGFLVHYKGTQLWIHHDSVGQTSLPMKRQALILFLKTQPTEIFITCALAE